MNRLTAAGLAGAVLGIVLLRTGSSSSPGNFIDPTPATPLDRRAAAVAIALREYARVNLPGAPHADPADYWAVASEQQLSAAELEKLDWCGGFYLWALKVAGIAPPSVFWRFDGTGIAAARLQPTTDPQPADLAYFTRNQHHAMIESVDGDTVRLINGNGGGNGITRSSVSRGQVAAFYSVDPLLRGSLDA